MPLAEAFGEMGDAGGHPNMAAATLPLHYFGKVENKDRAAWDRDRADPPEVQEPGRASKNEGKKKWTLNSGSPTICEILAYFGFERADDETAARLLASLMTRDNLLLLEALTLGNEVTVCGNAPCLKNEWEDHRGDLCSRCCSGCARCARYPPGRGLYGSGWCNRPIP